MDFVDIFFSKYVRYSNAMALKESKKWSGFLVEKTINGLNPDLDRMAGHRV